MLEVGMEAARKGVFKVAEDVNSYWRIYASIKLHLQAFLQNITTEIHDEDEFWKAILGNRFSGGYNDPLKLYNGQIIELKDFF